MATTSLNPGVGPTNADIATAVAAPSAATIAAAVAAPSAATIAAAVAAPSAATIASAVAAPSSATIASAVAAAVPTTAGITSIVQANAGSPYAGTLTNLGVVNPGNVTTTTITGLGGYKYLKIFCMASSTSAGWHFHIRFNGDAGGNYFSAVGASHTVGGNGWFAADSMRLNLSSAANNPASAMLEINDASTAALKMITARGVTQVSGQNWVDSTCIGVWNSTSAITSIQIFTTGGQPWDQGCRIFITGAN
jgi:hypothetical protein